MTPPSSFDSAPGSAFGTSFDMSLCPQEDESVVPTHSLTDLSILTRPSPYHYGYESGELMSPAESMHMNWSSCKTEDGPVEETKTVIKKEPGLTRAKVKTERRSGYSAASPTRSRKRSTRRRNNSQTKVGTLSSGQAIHFELKGAVTEEEVRNGKCNTNLPNEKLTPCILCGTRFKRKEHLGRHMSTKHEEEKRFKCCFAELHGVMCLVAVSRNDNLVQHMGTHIKNSILYHLRRGGRGRNTRISLEVAQEAIMSCQNPEMDGLTMLTRIQTRLDRELAPYGLDESETKFPIFRGM